jgi:pantoate--beta-alanine ligase
LKIFKTRAQLADYIEAFRADKKTIGFVPTMGALHEGHISLLTEARNTCDVVVCSIFVNPTQFNDPADLEKYPRPIEQDIQKVIGLCDVLFMPDVNEMYAPNEVWHIELGQLERILEGQSRPGHYQGVTQIVKKLFDAVKPDKAFFGQKDFQQIKVIEAMVKKFHLPVELVMCPIVREPDGLAMSSRNIHLSEKEHQTALALSRTLFFVKEHFESDTINKLNEDALRMLAEIDGLTIDYFQICTSDNLEVARSKNGRGLVALIAAQVGKTRLIDNIILQ